MKVRSSTFCNATGKAWQSSFLERFHFNQRDTKIITHIHIQGGVNVPLLYHREA